MKLREILKSPVFPAGKKWEIHKRKGGYERIEEKLSRLGARIRRVR